MPLYEYFTLIISFFWQLWSMLKHTLLGDVDLLFHQEILAVENCPSLSLGPFAKVTAVSLF